MDLQHVNVKVYIQDSHNLDFSEFNPVFQTWIQENLTEEMLIDVADYLHVPEGPGMVLVGLEADYSMDNTDNRWGLRYNRKTGLEGSDQDRLRQALQSALKACERLESDPRLKGKLKFNLEELDLFINDRALAPNNSETFDASKPVFEEVLNQLFGDKKFNMEPQPEIRARFGVKVRHSNSPDLKTLIKNLS